VAYYSAEGRLAERASLFFGLEYISVRQIRADAFSKDCEVEELWQCLQEKK
jgi:hypothetical protein